jgi:hypothetical protein
MDEDPLISKLYREVLGEISKDHESKDSRLRNLHERFEMYKDEEIMKTKLSSEFFDVNQLDVGDVEYSTEFTDYEE